MLGFLNPPVAQNVFLKQMRHLKKHYHVLSMDSLLDILKSGKPIPPRAIVLHFDDANRNHYSVTFPILKQWGLCGTFYVSTAFVEEARPFWWEELEYMVEKAPHFSRKKKTLRELAARFKELSFAQREELLLSVRQETGLFQFPAELFQEECGCLSPGQMVEMERGGMTFGAHTVHHAVLTCETQATQRLEIVEAKRALENWGLRADHFCYPNGGAKDFDASTKNIVREAGFQSGATALEGMCDIRSDLYALPRVWAPPGFSEFVCTVSGLKIFLKRFFGGRRDRIHDDSA